MGMRLGNSLSLVIFGESHAVGVGVLIEGLKPGLPIGYIWTGSNFRHPNK